MAYYEYNGNDGRQMKFIVDTEAEIQNLPTNIADGTHGNDKVMAGSLAYCIATADLYILNSAGVWTKAG